MKFDDFIEEIKLFQESYIAECMVKWELIYSQNELAARTVCVDYYGNKWKIPYSVYNKNGRDLVGIDIGDAVNLCLNRSGLYCFLWHEACSRMAIAA